MKAIRAFLPLLLIIICISCNVEKDSFISIKESQFIKNGEPYHYVGTNYWYGGLLGCKEGNQSRLLRELDDLKSNGIVNLRIMIGAEGGDQDYTVREPLQPQQGVFIESRLEGLDFLLSEMKKRDLTAILYFTNNWEWSGGMAKYLEWNGYGVVPNPNIAPNTWPQFMAYTAQFHTCEPCKEALKSYIKKIITRTNSVSKVKYSDDPTIMAWEVANEPRVFTPENEKAFTNWLNDVTAYIKSLDKNHLVTTGSEGKAGSNDDLLTFERTHNNPNIDYLTMHIWPKNWGWYKIEDEAGSTPVAIQNTLNYIEEHIKVAKKLNKPIVLEEFGYPRVQENLDRNASAAYRNQFYKAVFRRLDKAIQTNEPFVALNFWGYGGFGKNNPENGKWNIGDDYTTDPPQEPQGLNSVFATEKSTLALMKDFNSKWNNN
ncbi:cellulase family glycosylhydrolase [Flavobacterium sp. NRK F10]|uniref:glycoside hydrolase 5 family protein n=1 Tax=Flavobacterium sp. NRK F10 TaxID=2954931 RepID=UPI00209196DD|nr:cellulase family glycosylhydrolase [Flavobacterium sp. NRK F10]MCO6176036.1 cellulase family glycosylhydrolase [Flavobacterium sp. NRK F10]